MAVAPTIEETKRAIFEEISKYNVRANEIFPIQQINLKMHERGFRSEDIHPALEQMIDDGLLISSERPHWTITEAGYAAM